MSLLRGLLVPIRIKIVSFLPRDALHKRGLCRRLQNVRPSVRMKVSK